jgi:hypothetical protein
MYHLERIPRYWQSKHVCNFFLKVLGFCVTVVNEFTSKRKFKRCIFVSPFIASSYKHMYICFKAIF